jgi:TetR/AcrR family transcriptional regulator, transcriptional repressor for nem operon
VLHGHSMARLKEFNEQQALDRAVDWFWARGYTASSIRDLANAMGIGGTSLYNAFGDKRALFLRCLDRYANRSSRERMARMEEQHPPKEAVRSFLGEIVERSLKDPDCKGCLLVNSALEVAPQDAEIGAAVAGYLDEIRSFFRRNVEAARRAGDLPKSVDVDAVSGHLLGIVMGIRALARIKRDRALMESIARPALALLDHPKSKSKLN